MVFQPSLEQDTPNNFMSLIEGLVEDIYNFSTLVPRVATHSDVANYLSDVEEVRTYMYLHTCKSSGACIHITCMHVCMCNKAIFPTTFTDSRAVRPQRGAGISSSEGHRSGTQILQLLLHLLLPLGG